MNRVLSDKKTCPDRSGVTLVEVLMALMIMAIGVSSVAVLFPISVLRSIQATQLTNGAIVKYNVESIVDIKPELIFDPDGDFVHLDPSISAAARRATLEEHVRGQENRNYIVDPFGFYTHAADGNGALALRFGNYGTAPGPTTGVPRFGGGLVTTNGRKVEGTSTRYPPAPPGSPEREALRLAALAFAGQGDGWDTQVDAQPGPLGPGTITLPADLDLTQVPTSQLVLPSDGNGLFYVEDPELYRVVVFSDSGKFSQAFPLIAIDTAANRVFYTEDLNNNGTLDTGEDFNMNGVLNARSLPNDFRIDIDGDGVLEAGEEQISRVLLQSRKVSDYSWMLNVRRRSDGLARSVDVVVRYNNGVSATDERLFEATFVPSGAGTTSRNVGVRLP